MARTSLGKLTVVLSAVTSGFGRDMKKANKHVTAMSSSVKRLGVGLAGVFSARALTNGLRESLELFGQQELAERRMAEALKLAGDNSKSALADFKRFASSIQQVTTYGDEAVLEISALGAALGKLSGQSLKDATTAAIGLAEVADLDTKSAMKLLARAAQGGSVDFSRYGIVIDKTKSKHEQFNDVLNAGMEGFKLATAEAKTYTGQLQQMNNAIGDAKENVGKLAAPAVSWYSGLVSDYASSMNSIVEQAGNKTALKLLAADVLSYTSTPGLLDRLAGGHGLEAIQQKIIDAHDRRQNALSGRAIRDRTEDKRIQATEANNKELERFNKIIDSVHKRFLALQKGLPTVEAQKQFWRDSAFDFTARTGLYNFDAFKQRLGIDSPISDLTRGLLSNFKMAPEQQQANRFGPQFAGAFERGSAAEYSARIAALGRSGNTPEAKTEKHTQDISRTNKQMVDLIRQYGLNQNQVVQVSF